MIVQHKVYNQCLRKYSGNSSHCKYPRNSSCVCQILFSPINQALVERISWLLNATGCHTVKALGEPHWTPPHLILGFIPHWTLRKIILKRARFPQQKLYAIIFHVINMCFISLRKEKKTWWVLVKNSSLWSDAVSLAIIFTESRHKSLTPSQGRRAYSQTE